MNGRMDIEELIEGWTNEWIGGLLSGRKKLLVKGW
jgi:hypothetical protein